MNELTGEAHLTWRRSTKCESGLCVEVATVPHATLVRDGKSPQGPHLSFDAQAWGDFLSALKAGEYDRY